jgi:hypothetical protein
VADDEPIAPGMLVTGAQDGTTAERLRLEEVLLTAVDGRPVRSSLASYCEAVGDVQSGDELDMTVLTGPGGKRQTVSVEFD